MSTCPHGGRRCFCTPAEPWESDRQVWSRFVLTIRVRIREIRQHEGISSSRGDEWKTFEPALPASRPPARKVGARPTGARADDTTGRPGQVGESVVKHDHACLPGCSIDWLLDPAGPSDPEWRARLRADLDTDPWVHRWKERNAS